MEIAWLREHKRRARKKKKKQERKAKKVNKPKKKELGFYASWEWKELRYKILLRDVRQCACCGAKPPEVKIVVDHIKPRRKFPELELDEGNLQVLCDSCNRGKSYKDETDFRSIDIEEKIIEEDSFWQRNL